MKTYGFYSAKAAELCSTIIYLSEGGVKGMGVNYIVILQDDFDWACFYRKNKEQALADIQNDFLSLGREKPELIADWNGFMVVNFYKTVPSLDEYRKVIHQYCSTAHYLDDSNPHEIKKL